MKSIMAIQEIRFLAVLLATFASVGHAKAPRKILHGENASILDFPYQVFMQVALNNGMHKYCGGTIIDARHILTAAHCIWQRNSSNTVLPGDIDVLTGTDNLDIYPYKNWVEVLTVNTHPNYTGTAEHDIAILKLTRSISFSNVRKPAGLPTEDISEGMKAILTGFGYRRIDQTGRFDPELQKLNVTVFSSAGCGPEPLWKPSPFLICALSKGLGAAYIGDSGGPLSYNGTVIGVLSQSTGQNGELGVFTRVYNYLSWIRSVIEG